jgi:hypothetical protein
MTGLVRKATLLAACGLVVAGAAMAGIPNAANSQKPCVLLMDLSNSNNNVGINPAICNQAALKVIVRDALNNPVAGSDVVLDFSTCGANPGPIMLATTQVDPAVTTACAGRTVLKTTNALGEVCFSTLGATNVTDPSGAHAFYTGLAARNLGPSTGVVCCKLYASGQLLGTQLVIVNKYDLTADGNVTGADGSFHLAAQGFQLTGAANYRTFADYNCDGTINAGDGSLHLASQGNALSGEPVYAGAYCP